MAGRGKLEKVGFETTKTYSVIVGMLLKSILYYFQQFILKTLNAWSIDG